MEINDEALSAIELVANTLGEAGIESVIVGATVPSILIFHGMADISENRIRATSDIDTAVSVNSSDEFERAKTLLLAEGFTRSGNESENILTLGNIRIDLLPTGPLMAESGMPGKTRSKQRVNIAGFQEALENAETIKLKSGAEFKIATLWAFVLLKILAYDDTELEHHANDIFLVLDSYEETSERRYNAPFGTTSGLTFETSGAYICGNDISKNIRHSIRDELILIVDHLLEEQEYSQIISSAILETKRIDSANERERLNKLIQSFRQGLLAVT